MESTFCPKCSTQLIINDNLRHSNFIKCPNCKISFENPHFLPREKTASKTDYKQSSSNSKEANLYLAGLISVVVIILVIVIENPIHFSFKSFEKSSAKEIKVKNDPYDNSVIQVKEYIKYSDYLKDPDSYDPISWSEVKRIDNEYVVMHTYRAKNSFGGYNVEKVIFALDTLGNVINWSTLEN